MREKGWGYTLAAYVAAAMQAVFIGLSFLFVKTALVGAGAFDVLAHRITIGFLAALVFIAVGRLKVKLSGLDMLRMLPAALLFPILVYLFQTLSLRTLPSTEAGIIQAVMPIFAMVLAFLMIGERSTKLQVAFICLSVFGVVFMLVMKGVGLDAFDGLGTLLMLLSVLSGAIYNNVARSLTKRYPWYYILFCAGHRGCGLQRHRSGRASVHGHL